MVHIIIYITIINSKKIHTPLARQTFIYPGAATATATHRHNNKINQSKVCTATGHMHARHMRLIGPHVHGRPECPHRHPPSLSATYITHTIRLFTHRQQRIPRRGGLEEQERRDARSHTTSAREHSQHTTHERQTY